MGCLRVGGPSRERRPRPSKTYRTIHGSSENYLCLIQELSLSQPRTISVSSKNYLCFSQELSLSHPRTISVSSKNYLCLIQKLSLSHPKTIHVSSKNYLSKSHLRDVQALSNKGFIQQISHKSRFFLEQFLESQRYGSKKSNTQNH